MAAAADDEATPGVGMPPQSRSRRPEQLKTLVQLLEVALERKPTITFGELATMVADVGPVVRVRGDPWSEDLSFWDGVVPPGKRDTQVSPQTLKQAVDGFRREIHRLELLRHQRKGRSQSPRGQRAPRSRSPSPHSASARRGRSVSNPMSGLQTDGSGNPSTEDIRAMLTDLRDMISTLDPPKQAQPDNSLREKARRRAKAWREELANQISPPQRDRRSSDSAKRPPHPASNWVYVLWDIENVSIPKALNPKTGVHESGFKVANTIRDFLAKKGVLHKGSSRERFKLYFRPKAQSTPDQLLRDLERGGFECVAAMTSKPEAADRLISEEIKRLCNGATEAHFEMVRLHQLLNQVIHEVEGWAEDSMPSPDLKSGPPLSSTSRPTLVLISSDFDFKNDLKAAHERGFRVVLIHDSSLSGERKEQYMRECHAKLYTWSDVMESVLRLAQEDKDARKRVNDAANKLALHPLSAEEIAPVLNVLRDHVTESERLGTDPSSIDRDGLIHKLNTRFAVRLPEDAPAIAVIEGYTDFYTVGETIVAKEGAPGSQSQSQLVLGKDHAPLLLNRSDLRPLKYYLKRVEASRVLERGIEEDRTKYFINGEVVPLSTDVALDVTDEWEDKRNKSGYSTPPLDEADNDPLSPILRLGSIADDDDVLEDLAPPLTPKLNRKGGTPNGSLVTSTPVRQPSTPTLMSIDDSYFDAVFGFAPNPPDETSPPPTPASYNSPDVSWRSLEAPGEDCRELSESDWGQFSATIVGSRKVAEGYTVFVIRISMMDGREYAVMRRFTEFEALRAKLEKVDPPLPPMPLKRLLKNSKAAIDERIAAFNAMIQRCMQLDESERGPVLAFLSDRSDDDHHGLVS